jgi:hypothetical protein
MKRLRVTILAIGVICIAVVIVRFSPMWRYLSNLMPVTPYALLTVYESQNCKIYIPYATPNDFEFVGDSLRHTASTRGEIIHDIGVSGKGTVLYKGSNIKIDYDQISINGQALTNKPCSYILNKSKLKIGALLPDE